MDGKVIKAKLSTNNIGSCLAQSVTCLQIKKDYYTG